MLINCPRCGFSQPKDQYCASCGVDMEKYTPRKANPFEKLLSNTFFQVVLVVGFTLTVSYFALKSKNEESMQTSRRKQVMSTMSNSSNLNTTVTNDSSVPQTPPAMTESSPAEGDVAIQLEAKNEEQRNQLAGGAAAVAAMNEDGATDGSKKMSSITVKFSFYEVDREVLNYWLQINGADPNSDAGDGVQSGIVNTDIMHKQIQMQPLKTETKKIGLTDKETFNAGVNREDDFVGLVSEIKLDELNENQLKGALRMIRKNTQGTEMASAALIIPKQNSFFFHWKSSLIGFDRESSILNVPPFQTIRLQRFGVRTELVVIIEPFF